jgi:hypothetical protein
VAPEHAGTAPDGCRVQIPSAKGIARPTNLDSAVPGHRIMQSRRRGPRVPPCLVGRLWRSMVYRPKRRGKPPDQPAGIALADAGCRRPTNPAAILAVHTRKPPELGGSRHPGSLGTLVALSGERRDRRPSHDEQTEHDHDRVTRASGIPWRTGTNPEHLEHRRPKSKGPTGQPHGEPRVSLERETGVEPATLGLGSQLS